MQILDVRKCSDKRVNLEKYSHILAYHACRSESEFSFRTHGLKPYTKDEALSKAIQLLSDERITPARIEAEFHPVWEYKRPNEVYLMLEPTEFLQYSAHYLIYGSELLNELAMRLNCRPKLTKIGKPTIIACAVPIEDISPNLLNELEDNIRQKSTANLSIIVKRVAAENIIKFEYPTGYVLDPYTWEKFKLG